MCFARTGPFVRVELDCGLEVSCGGIVNCVVMVVFGTWVMAGTASYSRLDSLGG
jgi:hypothetical protein